MSAERPNPDALLAQVAEQEQKELRGRLKVFFGAAPGVGKTYAMLEEGRARAAEGMDVVVGYAEPHARSETEALLLGMEILPYKTIEYRGATLKELDIDAVLHRRPHLVLIDELAHTNAPGMRHQKRWQDVAELLAAGIHVYTTLNVQHLESVNDIIERITGVKVRETLSDDILARADEIEMIDTSPEELLERFREGKVYRPEQAERATKHFFTKGNLIALRELALRRAAERVDAQMQDFRRDNRVSTTWAVTERILVCVGPSPLSARVVRSAKRLASGLRATLIAAYVDSSNSAYKRDADRKRLEANLHLAEQLGAEVVRLSGQSVADEITAFAKLRNVTKIVIGKPERTGWTERFRTSLVDAVIRQSGEIDVHVIRGDADENTPPTSQPPPRKAVARSRGVTSAVATVIIATLIGYPLYHSLKLSNSNVLMLYLLGVLWVATHNSRFAAALASVLGVVAFDFFFVPPEYSFTVSDRQYMIVFVVMLFTALLISTLTDRIRSQVSAARSREHRTAILYALSRELASASSATQIATIATRHFTEATQMPGCLLLPDKDGHLKVIRPVDQLLIDEKEIGTAQWVFDHGQSAGRGTSTLPASDQTYFPLRASEGIVGVLAMKPPASGNDGIEQRQLIEAMTAQVAQAIERTNLSAEARNAWERVESEFLRNTLLSGVSHELRTPLAAITGALSAAVDTAQPVGPEARDELLHTALSESERMDRLINNLLDMTRLESGGLKLNRDWHNVDDLVRSAIAHMKSRLSGKEVRTCLPPGMPMIYIDGLAIEQVLLNLLDNANEYAPGTEPIEVSASVISDEVMIDVSDHGPGLLPGTEKKVFEKFYRAATATSRRGIGLGLAICSGIIGSHGGQIEAFNRPTGGATFRIRLRVENAPPVDTSG